MEIQGPCLPASLTSPWLGHLEHLQQKSQTPLGPLVRRGQRQTLKLIEVADVQAEEIP